MTAYTVVGAGAIGGTLAFHLTAAGHEVVVVDADSEHVEAIRHHGLTLRGAGQPDRTARMRAVTPAEIGDLGRLDAVLLAVKSQATAAAVDLIAPSLSGDGCVVSLQNGLNERTIATRVGPERTIGAFVNFAADVLGPGVIGVGGPGALVIGELDGTASARVDALAADLQAWGPARASTNVEGFLWSKMGYGTMLVATSLADAPMADLVDRHRRVMHRAVREVFAVAAAGGVTLEAFDAFDPAGYTGTADQRRADEATDRLVAWLHTLDKKRSGIWRDIVVRRRPTEVPHQYAPVLARAREYGVPVPTLSGVLENIRRLEAGEVAMGEELLTELDT
ncbi:ketopantoate reductase family protein [Kribbella swartbergensis]